jgi:hypothetical protein
MEMPTHHAVRLACGIALYLLFLAWVIWPKKREVDDNPEIPPITPEIREMRDAAAKWHNAVRDNFPPNGLGWSDEMAYNSPANMHRWTRLSFDAAWAEAHRDPLTTPLNMSITQMDWMEHCAALGIPWLGFQQGADIPPATLEVKGSGEIHTGRDYTANPGLLERAPYAPVNVFLPRGCKCSMTREGENFIVAHNPACPILRHRPDVNE